MKIILIGSDRSTGIIDASKYLFSKYLPGFDTVYLTYNGVLDQWSNYLAGFLAYLTDEKVIIGLDDFLIEETIDWVTYQKASMELGGDVVCVKLCRSTEEEHKMYPVTTQLSIWNRKYLIWLLRQTYSPWDFELRGRGLIDKTVLLRTCIQYDGNSALSGKWPGVNLGKLTDEDVYYLRSNKML